ncbi:MAG: hypothetical protein RLZZ09_783, partial [Pseudomonadota bacterium]
MGALRWLFLLFVSSGVVAGECGDFRSTRQPFFG